MPTYVSLFSLTTKGRENIRESNDRRDRGIQMVESFGGEVKHLYYGVGPYDAVGVFEFPDTVAASKVKLVYEQMGLMAMETFEVFSPQEWAAIIEDATS